MLWQILAMLAGLESDPTEADQLRKQAGEIVAYTADHTSDPDLSASFLSLPQVQAVIA